MMEEKIIGVILPTIMENQMEKKMENEMETGIMGGNGGNMNLKASGSRNRHDAMLRTRCAST